MKVLYANPIFLNYRIPFYKELNKLFEGNFYILYSRKRYLGRSNYEPLLKLIPEQGTAKAGFAPLILKN